MALDPVPLPDDRPGDVGELIEQFITFYGWPDKDPPGPGIAYPRSRWPTAFHDQAGGVGTYEAPITVASDPTEWAVGTRSVTNIALAL